MQPRILTPNLTQTTLHPTPRQFNNILPDDPPSSSRSLRADSPEDLPRNLPDKLDGPAASLLLLLLFNHILPERPDKEISPDTAKGRPAAAPTLTPARY